MQLIESPDAETRAAAAHSFFNQELDPKTRAALFRLAQSDPDAKVRGRAWESLADATEDAAIRDAMLAVLTDTSRDIAERGGAAVGLYAVADRDDVESALFRLCTKRTASWRARKRSNPCGARCGSPTPASFRSIWTTQTQGNRAPGDPRRGIFSAHAPHRQDRQLFRPRRRSGRPPRGCSVRLRAGDAGRDHARPDPRHAAQDRHDRPSVIERSGAGHVRARRTLTAGRARSRVCAAEESAEQEADEPEPPPTPAGKVGRNDPCPCGSGKKYKKCHGA